MPFNFKLDLLAFKTFISNFSIVFHLFNLAFFFHKYFVIIFHFSNDEGNLYFLLKTSFLIINY